MPMREDALPQPVSPYGVSKLAAEQLCYLYFANFGSRPFRYAISPSTDRGSVPTWRSTSFCARRSLGEPIALYGDGDQTRDFTFVSDAVTANVAAGDRGVPGRVYNIGGGSRVSVNDVLDDDRARHRPTASRHVDPAQKGDMRHTYADTSRARADLGFAPTVALEAGARGRVSMADWNTVIRRDRSRSSSARRSAVRRGAGARRGACASGPRKHRAGRHDRARQVPLRQRHRGAQQQEVAHRARVLQAGHRNLHREPVSARRQARHRRHLPGRRHRRKRWCWRSTSSASSCRSTRPTAAPTTRSSSSAWRTSGRCGCRSAIRPRRARRSRNSTPSSQRYPNSSLMPEAKARLRETRDRLSEADYQVGYFYYRQKWYPGAIDRFKVGAEGRSGFTNRDASTSIWPTRWSKVKARGRGAAAAREARRGVREERASGARAEDDRAISRLRAAK